MYLPVLSYLGASRRKILIRMPSPANLVEPNFSLGLAKVLNIKLLLLTKTPCQSLTPYETLQISSLVDGETKTIKLG